LKAPLNRGVFFGSGQWYEETRELGRYYEITEGERYVMLACADTPVLGLASAAEMGVRPHADRQNAVHPQFRVADPSS
jgi:hypothetical protein